MTVREVIKALLDQPLDCEVYVGKGMGPVQKVAPEISGDRMFVIIGPVPCLWSRT